MKSIGSRGDHVVKIRVLVEALKSILKFSLYPVVLYKLDVKMNMKKSQS